MIKCGSNNSPKLTSGLKLKIERVKHLMTSQHLFILKTTTTTNYWFAPGAQSHLHVPGATRSGEGCLKFIPRVTPLNAGELKVLKDTLEAKPMKTPGKGGKARKTYNIQKRENFQFKS